MASALPAQPGRVPVKREGTTSLHELANGLPGFRVLACDELLRHILGYLTEPAVDDVEEGRSTLAALAAVCKTVSPTAISMLWERLESIHPVSTLYELLSVTETSSSVPLGFQHYISQVRSIEIDSGTVPQALLGGRDEAVFPNLRRLHWVVPSKALIQPFYGFVVSTLSELRVDITSHAVAPWDAQMSSTLIDALDCASHRCPSLTTLELHWIHGPFSPAARDVLHTLKPIHSLQSLTVSASVIACAPALRVLSQLQSLRFLGISHFGDSSPDVLRLDAVGDGFNLLQKLSVTGPAPLVHDILRCMPVCAVRHCTIALVETCSEHGQHTIAQQVVSKFGASLGTLSFRFPDEAYFSDPATHSPFSIGIASMLQDLELVDVRLGWLDSQQFTDELCRELARSWPRLRVLHLWPAAIVLRPSPSMATLRGLRSFAELCPALSDIVIQVDASGEHWAAEAASLPLPTQRRNAVSLNLTTSLVTAPNAVAAYLGRIFPQIARLRFNRVEARMCRQGGRVPAWDQLCDSLLSEHGM